MATRILLVDNHRVLLDGLRSMLDREEDFEVVGVAQDGRNAISMVKALSPDVVVMDIGMPDLNGIEATSRILHDYPEVKVVALSMHTDGNFVRAMLEAGAHAYVTKEAASSELLCAIRKVRSRMKYLSSDVTGVVVEGYINRAAHERESSAMTDLAGREREVLQLIAEGLNSGEIGARLHISINTVDTHRRNIMKKLDLHSIAELTKYAVREGLTEIES